MAVALMSPLKIVIFASNMKNLFLVVAAFLLAGAGLVSCNDDDTYAERKEHERKAISSFLNNGTCVLGLDSKDTILNVKPINVISEEKFHAQDSTTDVSKNEYVLIKSAGVYMQIVDKGSGKKLESGETAKVITRFLEFNILGDSLMCRNNSVQYIAVPDIMNVSNSYGVFTASFLSGVMQSYHRSIAVPNGWMIPFAYINLGRQTSSLARVRLIVPHDSGTTDAQSTSGVYPCFYELTFQRGR